ncbi:hypothetical protein EBB79_13305 [Parasedimentitalea marina]|uniref:Uncharacterized protein n=1 Tax=Parasedimentitalea marina TaxID=2483033 RepID=A0A3T0N434_9RHOB|nr:hypothetical protein EBB79_13305 [Parasedimentitalea marina]
MGHKGRNAAVRCAAHELANCGLCRPPVLVLRLRSNYSRVQQIYRCGAALVAEAAIQQGHETQNSDCGFAASRGNHRDVGFINLWFSVFAGTASLSTY